jgi:phage/plasmid-associated DNA primase
MEKLNASSRRTPCPICGRTKDGDCRISDELVLCHYGSDNHPPLDLKSGQVITGMDGQEWAFTGEAQDRRTATFTRHKPRSTSHQGPVQTRQSQPPTPQLARLESPAKEPPAHLPAGQRINYSSTQWVEIVRNGNDKKHIPHHQDDEGRAQRGAGDEPWPLWRQDDAITHGQGMWIAEAEGEKCGEWFDAGGVVAISQPGHDHKPASIERRYRTLVEAGVAGVLYLADNDETGRKKAERCAAAAATVGLPLLVLHASDVWSDMPVGGSIDDAPGTAAERVAAVVAAIPAAIERIPVGNLLVEEHPAEPHKQKNVAFTHERVCHLACALGNELRADHEQSTAWLHFDGTKWAAHHSNDKVNELLEELYDRWDWTIRDSTTVNSDRAGVRRAVGSDLPPANIKCLPFTNGCLDLETKALIAHSPEHGNKYCLPFAYESGQPAPTKILSFLEARLGSSEVVQLYRAFIWHILTNTCMKAYLEITGPGNTGKTVLTNLVIALIGIENTTSCSLKRIEDTSNRFETNRIRSKRLAVFSESQEYSGPLEMLKALTGQDRIPAERKHSSAIFDYVFTGGVILTGNSPIRSSDTTGAVINRRRSIIVDKVVAAANERVLIEFDGYGGLRGELVPELPAFVDWVLQMPPAEARRAIARDVASSARADAEKQVLLRTDHLAAWANENLIFDHRLGADEKPFWSCQVGNLDSDRNYCMLPNYKHWLEQREQVRSYGQRNFKNKLVDLLRDTIGLPLPPGDHSKGFYRIDGTGSVVPFVRFRRSTDADDVPGVIDSAFAKRVAPLDQRMPNGKTLVSKGTNESNDKSDVGLPCEVETAQKGSSEQLASNREMDSDPTHLNRLFHWPQGSERSQPVGNSLGSGADAFSDDDDPAWGPRAEVA